MIPFCARHTARARTRGAIAFGLAALLAGACGQALAQSYPVRPVRIVTTTAASSSDLVARLIGEKISPVLGEPIVIDNRGVIAAEIVARAAPDGYTLVSYGSPLWIAPLLREVPYDPIADFAPITLTADSPNVLVVHPSLPVKTVQDLIALAKRRPGELNYGSSSTGATPHLAAELFRSLAGVKIVRVPYKGSGPALTALVGGEVQLMFPNAGAVSGYLKSGKVRALAVTTAQPSPLAPGIPTMAAAGLPGCESSSPLAILAPARTPAAIVAKLHQEMARALGSADIKARLFNYGLESIGSSPEQLSAMMKEEMAKWGKLIKEAGIRQ
jgi:tripartite-type tricarboxylate transporter receptor subunit TctC